MAGGQRSSSASLIEVVLRVGRGGEVWIVRLIDLRQDKKVCEIIFRLETAKDKGGVVKVEGMWGSFAPYLTAFIFEQLCRPILYISPHIDDADKIADDLQTFAVKRVKTLAAWEGAEDLPDATDEIHAERLCLALKLAAGKTSLIIPTSIQALCQPIPKPEAMQKSSLVLGVKMEVSPEELVGWLVDNSFEPVERIDLPGQFARRGGIVDVFAPVTVSEKRGGQALRIEFFGDTIESIREIDLDTQRSSHQIEQFSLVSAVCGSQDDERELLLNILPKETIVLLDEPDTIEEVANVFLERTENAGRLYSWKQIYEGLRKFTQLHVCRFADTTQENFVNLDIKSVQRFQRAGTSLWAGHKEALEELVNEARGGKKVYFYCETKAEINRVTEIIQQDNKRLPSNFKLLLGFINQGFVIDSLKTIAISHHELFGQFALRRRWRSARPSAPIETLEDLQAGDYVVHISHGIGKFLGINTIEEKGSKSEYLTIEFADGVKIHVPAVNITLVQKYIGTSPKRPGLSKVGSKKWQRQKEKVARSVADLAGQLLEVQAKRENLGGFAFGEDSSWQVEFEESFPYQDTADQTTAAEQIKNDMQQVVAMDRLLCGDVGYGKTELAMRAAFKAVEGGKQVAMLVPTTILCVQHGRTFAERFAGFPLCIEVLNRFKTTKQARGIIDRARNGKVDILIGTHRLLSEDVGFKDLGLLVIDEEQRFGVEHKEKLKTMRVNVDVLTMTATPIPRTLHMSLLGLRDISSLSTPPLDRRSIVTSVGGYSRKMIRRGIIRELNRQGQVFFLHNRVRTIDKKAWEIRKLISDTDAKIGIAHGQMAKSELEQTMIDFVMGRIDVLVCTTIIESGLDIPNANTIFIDNADRFGLAELHQLRGRVGRYKHRAYAYMLLPANRSITPIAGRRLKAIEEYSHLGAGFRIALRDLEIRGAGNILGAAQSGHIQLVGYQMYCDLLSEAVGKLKGEKITKMVSAAINLGFATYIPKNYIPSDRLRMDTYRKIAAAGMEGELEQIANELADVYGAVPDEVTLLLELAEMGIKAGKLNIKSIIASGQNLIFSFVKHAKLRAETLFADIGGKITAVDAQTIYLRLPKNYFEPKTLLTLLRKILRKDG